MEKVNELAFPALAQGLGPERSGVAAKSYRELFPRLRGVKPQSGGGLGRPPEDIIQGRLVLATLKPEFAGI